MSKRGLRLLGRWAVGWVGWVGPLGRAGVTLGFKLRRVSGMPRLIVVWWPGRPGECQGQNQYFPLFRLFVFRLFCLGFRV